MLFKDPLSHAIHKDHAQEARCSAERDRFTAQGVAAGASDVLVRQAQSSLLLSGLLRMTWQQQLDVP